MGRITYDKEKISLNTAKLKKEGAVFEIDIDSDAALAFREGRNIDIKDVLKVEKIFSDVKKGMLASETQMNTLFGTSDPLEVAKIILKTGEIQLTAEYKKKLREQKKKRIIGRIHRNGVDPRTHAPHPVERIEAAMEEAKFHVDEFKSVEDQVSMVLKKIKLILPIRFETKEIQVIIPSAYAGKSYSVVKGFGKMLKDEWMNDGSLKCIIELPAGMEAEFFDKLNSLTHGNIESKIIKSG